MYRLEYEDCKIMWDTRNRYHEGYAFASKKEMVSFVCQKSGVVISKHPEVQKYAARYLKEVASKC